MWRFLAACAIVWFSAAAAAPIRERFQAWQLDCSEECVIAQEVGGRHYRIRAEISFPNAMIMFRLSLPQGARHGENVYFATRDKNQIALAPACDESTCVVTHQFDPIWLASTMEDLYLFVDFTTAPGVWYRAGFNWPGLQEAMMSAHSR